MEVILLEKIENVGAIGDRVKVKSGFARNFLIPQGKATLATARNIEKFEKIRAELEARAEAEVGDAKARAAQVEGKVITITVQAGPEGRLFGSVGTLDIADAFAAMGVEVERSEIRLPEGPLRIVGEHEIEVHLHSDVNASVKVVLEPAEGSQRPLIEEEPADEDDTDQEDI
jgi:large subunit ribosomal protein L9